MCEMLPCRWVMGDDSKGVGCSEGASDHLLKGLNSDGSIRANCTGAKRQVHNPSQRTGD